MQAVLFSDLPFSEVLFWNGDPSDSLSKAFSSFLYFCILSSRYRYGKITKYEFQPILGAGKTPPLEYQIARLCFRQRNPRSTVRLRSGRMRKADAIFLINAQDKTGTIGSIIRRLTGGKYVNKRNCPKRKEKI